MTDTYRPGSVLESSPVLLFPSDLVLVVEAAALGWATYREGACFRYLAVQMFGKVLYLSDVFTHPIPHMSKYTHRHPQFDNAGGLFLALVSWE